jgi:pSer/pThr/pTyr-binding forkhead associated (FHA) protein
VTHRGIHLVDLGSTNGTYVREHRVGEGIIGHQDEFVIGDFTIRCILKPREAVEELDDLVPAEAIRGVQADPNRTLVSAMPRPKAGEFGSPKAPSTRKAMLAL